MTDFYAQLEEQLVAAGRRRQAQGRVARAVAGRGRMLAATAATVVVLVAGAAVALPPVLTTSSSTPAAPPAAPTPAPGGRSLAGIRVAVFNATPLPGVARTVAEELGSQRARIILLGSTAPQPSARTVVWYRPGAKTQARRVAAVLGVARVRRFDQSNATAIPPPSAQASVIVLVGFDRQARPVPPAVVVPGPSAVPQIPPTETLPAVPPPVAPAVTAVPPAAPSPP